MSMILPGYTGSGGWLNNGPIPSIQPFTYSDALTYLDILTYLKKYLEDLREYVNQFPEMVNKAIAELILEVEARISAIELKVQQEIDENHVWVLAQIAELTQFVNDTVQLIIDDSIQLQDPVLAGILSDPDSQSRGVANGIFVSKPSIERNILDYGVERDNPDDNQATAILAAFNAHPGDTFYFPRGSYRIDSSLIIDSGNSIHLADGARIWAGSAMDWLILHNGSNSNTIREWVADKGIYGAGILDGNLLARDVLGVRYTLRFRIGDGLVIQDPIERGLVTGRSIAGTIGPYGVEFTVSKLRIHNSTAENYVNSIGIDSGTGDSHYYDIIVRDFNIGVKEHGSNFWSMYHPWIGTNPVQLGPRYPDSIGFWCVGARPTLTDGYMDTYRYCIKVSRDPATNSVGRVILNNLRTLVANSAESGEIIRNNPGFVLDVDPGCIVDSNFGYYNTRPDSPRTFVRGDKSKLTIRGGAVTLADIPGFQEYEKGVAVGTFEWTPTLSGSAVAGEHVYTRQRGQMIVTREGLIQWSFEITATIDGTADGNMRVSGVPLSEGMNTLLMSPMGVVATSSANINTFRTLQAGTWPGTTTGNINVLKDGATSINMVGLRGEQVSIAGTFSAPYRMPII